MIKFGTDGWRAVISEEFTFDNVKIVAQAMADFINKDPRAKDKQIVVGYDTRFLSERYAQTVACVLAANGIGVILTDRAVPTPAVSFAILNKKLGGGIMITASHNPAEFNGIKYKAYYGGSADPQITKVMEQKLYKNRIRFLPLEEAKKVLVKIENIMPDYLKAIGDYVDIKAIKDRECRVLVDIMHGAGDSYIAKFLSGGKCRVDNIR